MGGGTQSENSLKIGVRLIPIVAKLMKLVDTTYGGKENLE